MAKVIVSAPGKIHLIGEHSVVYGEPAIISSVGLETCLEFSESREITFKQGFVQKIYSNLELITLAKQAKDLWDKGNTENNFSQLFSLYQLDAENFIKIAIGTLLDRFDLQSGLKINCSSTLPQGSGLGSSASFAVALSAGFQKFIKDDFNLNEINQNAFLLEQLVNGRPSGGDNSTCCFGGLIRFQKASEKNNIKIEPLTLNNLKSFSKFVLINTGKPTKTTGELVAEVAKLKTTIRVNACEKITSYIDPLLKSLEESDDQQISFYLNATHVQLDLLNVSTPLLNKLQFEISQFGGGAKLCGAGGGGILLCYHNDTKFIFDLAKKYNLESYQVHLAVKGVSLVI